MSNEQIVRSYLDAIVAHDTSAARACLADNFKFHGPLEQHDSADAFMAAFGNFMPSVTGIVVDRIVADGSDVVATYDFQTSLPGAEHTRTCEYFTLDGDKIVASQLYFDATP